MRPYCLVCLPAARETATFLSKASNRINFYLDMPKVFAHGAQCTGVSQACIPQDISIIVWAMGTLVYVHPALEMLLGEVLRCGADKFNAQGISNMIYALGKLEKAQHPALEALLGEVLRYAAPTSSMHRASAT